MRLHFLLAALLVSLQDASKTQHKIRPNGIDVPVAPWDFRKMKREGSE